MRIINAEAFERDIRNELRKHSEEKDSLVYRLYEAFLDEVKSRPTIEQSQWISCAERLPTKEDADEIGRVWAKLRGEHPKAFRWNLVSDYPKDFTYWISLPQLPREV